LAFFLFFIFYKVIHWSGKMSAIATAAIMLLILVPSSVVHWAGIDVFNGTIVDAENASPIYISPESYADSNSPCYDNSNTSSQTYLTDCYEFLAPIPGIQNGTDASTANYTIKSVGEVAQGSTKYVTADITVGANEAGNGGELVLQGGNDTRITIDKTNIKVQEIQS